MADTPVFNGVVLVPIAVAIFDDDGLMGVFAEVLLLVECCCG